MNKQVKKYTKHYLIEYFPIFLIYFPPVDNIFRTGNTGKIPENARLCFPHWHFPANPDFDVFCFCVMVIKELWNRWDTILMAT